MKNDVEAQALQLEQLFIRNNIPSCKEPQPFVAQATKIKAARAQLQEAVEKDEA